MCECFSSVSTLPDAIRLFRAVNMFHPPLVLLHADYDNLFNYFAYKLLHSQTWAGTDTGREYIYFSERNIPCNNILQGEAGRYASLLYNDVHPDAPMRVLSPYRPIHLNLPLDIEIPGPMLDEPPQAPPHAPIITAFSYDRRQAPPGTYSKGYLPFAGANNSGGEQPTQPPGPPPPNAPQTWTLL